MKRADIPKAFLLVLGLLISDGKSFLNASTSRAGYGKVKCDILCIGMEPWLNKVAGIIAEDMAFTDQLTSTIQQRARFNPKLVGKLFNEGITLCCTLKAAKDTNGKPGVKLTFYDTSTKFTLVEELIACNSSDHEALIETGHSFADKIINCCTNDSIALSELAYCKEISRTHKVICLTDYSGNKEREIVSANTVNVVPAWHPTKPLLFYTQLTKTNNRLMSVHLNSKKHNIVASFNGLNMQPSFSKDGKTAVLCLSIKGNSELYLFDAEESAKQGRRAFKQLTHNKGNNVAPCMLPNDDILFCSDFETKLPQLYCLRAKTKRVDRLTKDGYCAAPSYCPKRRMVVFSKPVRGTFQLFTLPLDKRGFAKEEKQLTFNDGDKQDPSWSPCGRYIAFSYQFVNTKSRREAQIAAINYASGRVRVLTSGKEHKFYPAWRPLIHS